MYGLIAIFPFQGMSRTSVNCFAHIQALKCLRGHLTCYAALMAANALDGS